MAMGDGRTFGPDFVVGNGALLKTIGFCVSNGPKTRRGTMKVHQGDRVILAASHTDEPTRDGEVLEVRGANGEPPYLVRWADGHTGLMYPGPGSILRVEAEHEQAASLSVARPLASAVGPTGVVVANASTCARMAGAGVNLRIRGRYTGQRRLADRGADPPDRRRTEPSRRRGTRPCPRLATRSPSPGRFATWPTSCSTLRPRTSRL